MSKKNSSNEKKIWAKPTIRTLRLRDTLSKEFNQPSEERNDAFPGTPGKFDNDGPS